jgi:hypothetical protein
MPRVGSDDRPVRLSERSREHIHIGRRQIGPQHDGERQPRVIRRHNNRAGLRPIGERSAARIFGSSCTDTDHRSHHDREEQQPSHRTEHYDPGGRASLLSAATRRDRLGE